MYRTREEKLRNLPNVLKNRHLAEREKVAVFMLGTGDFGNSARIARICDVSEFWLSLHEKYLRRKQNGV